MKLTKTKLKQIIKEEIDLLILNERRKTSYKPERDRRGRTESGAQQKAAGAAWGCRKKRGEEREKCAKKLKNYGGAAWELYDGEITNDELRKLATIRRGAEIPSDTPKGKKREALPKKLKK